MTFDRKACPPEKNSEPLWGLLPEAVAAFLSKKYWCNTRKRKRLLKGEDPFPLQLSLKPPGGAAILEDINHFQAFVSSWRRFSNVYAPSCTVCWEKRNFRHLAEQNIPTGLTIHSIHALAQLLGEQETQALTVWQSKMSHTVSSLSALLGVAGSAERRKKEKALFLTLIDHLEALNRLDWPDLNLLASLIPQLRAGMGEGGYLRALPVHGVDTKFIENNFRLVEAITAAVQTDAMGEGGLLRWLGCKDKPRDWLLVRPLCEQSRAALGGVPLLRLSSDTLLEFALPADNILVIENEQSCLALPELAQTIAVAGGGKNVTWLQAGWLTSRRVGYWGDIDSEGLGILSDARSRLSTLTPLMMDAETVVAYQERMVDEPDSVIREPLALTRSERDLFRALRSGRYGHGRLEQERLPMDYIVRVMGLWLADGVS